MSLMAQVDRARSTLQAANEQLSEARGLLGKPKQEAPKEPEEKGFFDRLKDTVSNVSLSDVGHTVLDLAGLVPVLGAPADGINALWYAAEGDWVNAGLSATGMIPFAGEAATAAKLVNRAVDAVRTADNAMDAAKAQAASGGNFSIPASRWENYPSGAPQPTGPFRLLEGDEYTEARKAANKANRALHRADPSLYGGKQIHEVHPVKFGGSPTDISNKVALTASEHAKFTTWWNRLQKELEK